MTLLLRSENITKNYTNHCALDNVSIEVSEQSIYGLLGPNGAGKTTLIRIINQIISPDQGHLFFRDQALNPAHVHKIGYLPEERGLYKKMKVGEQAIYLAQLKGLKRQQARKLLKGWFDKFDLLPWWDKKVEELSKGMQQKVQFIITVLHQPELLIFDEPFSGFDPINVNLLKQEILRLRNEGATIIFSTHNMGSVEELCDHIALIDKSKKILDGNVRQVKKDHATHIFQLEMEGLKKPLENILDKPFEIIKTWKHNGHTMARVKVNAPATSNDLVKKVLDHSHLVAFSELTPTMNDIFIKNVTGKYPMETHDANHRINPEELPLEQ